MIGSQHCAVEDSLVLAAVSWQYATANCTTPPAVAGYYNLSISMQDSSLGWGVATNTNYRAFGGMLVLFSIICVPFLVVQLFG